MDNSEVSTLSSSNIISSSITTAPTIAITPNTTSTSTSTFISTSTSIPTLTHGNIFTPQKINANHISHTPHAPARTITAKQHTTVESTDSTNASENSDTPICLFLVGGIVAFILILALVFGIVVYIKIHKKRKRERLAAAKNGKEIKSKREEAKKKGVSVSSKSKGKRGGIKNRNRSKESLDGTLSGKRSSRSEALGDDEAALHSEMMLPPGALTGIITGTGKGASKFVGNDEDHMKEVSTYNSEVSSSSASPALVHNRAGEQAIFVNFGGGWQEVSNTNKADFSFDLESVTLEDIDLS